MNSSPHSINTLTDHLFRHESGKMVAVLTKIFGTENLETVEDVIQQTFMDAIQVWKLKGIPENPSAWLFRVAKNKAIDIIRKNKHSLQYDFNDSERALLKSEYTLMSTMDHLWKDEMISDDMLRMMFACCHQDISQENQITLILKTLCGFSTAEIAKAFLTSEDTISKRLFRTKTFFRNQKIKLEIPSSHELKNRTDAVLNSIYLLFNEGYNSTHSDELIRKNLIEEAKLLCKLLCDNPHTQQPETFALMALICFHSARSDSRLTTEGEIILLPDQDRKQWNWNLIAEGNDFMNKAAFGNTISTYHLEAAIAYEHCTTPTFEQTNWQQILNYYEMLCNISNSPIIEMNRAVAVMQVYGAHEALQFLQNMADHKKLESYYLYHSLLGEINTRLHHTMEAKQHFEKAIGLTQSDVEKKMLKVKMGALLN
ncbi:MAG: sigma-70 family RNA polymerase sigma factor [Saprospiraceae bacterium]|nr:sigma-70 family RNA polymerase sigma factor [Candidatus Defluviibacterium haderslevense]